MRFIHKIAFILLGIKDHEQREVIVGMASNDTHTRDKAALLLLNVKNEEQAEYILAIRDGNIYVREEWNEYWNKYYETKTKFFQIHKCTEKEIELGKIVVLAEKGLSQKKIAAELGLSATQVGTRCKRYGITTIGMR